MPLSQTEAAEALRDISQAERRSSAAYGYRLAAPHLILWGVVWFIGYGLTYARVSWTWVWLPLIAIGIAGSFWIGVRSKVGAERRDWRYSATALAVFVFIWAIFMVLPPRTDAQTGAFFPILVSLYYAVIGIWSRGLRILLTGAALVALTLIGFFWLQQYFLLWMAVVGGGGLILGGLWLRNV